MTPLLILATCQCFYFTAPVDRFGVVDDSTASVQSADHYEAQLLDQYGVTALKTVHRDSTCNGQPRIPGTPGTRDTVWLSISDDARFRLYRIRAVGANGLTAKSWSNGVARGSGTLPDQGYAEMVDNPRWSRSRQAYGRWVTDFTRTLEDSALVMDRRWRDRWQISEPVLDLREFQRLDSPKACETLRALGEPAQWADGEEWKPCP